MIKKLLLVLFAICLICTLIFALRGKNQIFSSTAILEILEDSPTVPTSWVLSIDNAKIIDSSFRFPKYTIEWDFWGATMLPYFVRDGFFELQIPFISSIWNTTIDAVKAICYVGTMISQAIVYCSYFFAYLFA